MFSKSICILLALLAFTAAETNSKQERQIFPEQFSQFTNQFQEAFGNPPGGSNPSVPQFPNGQLPNGFPTFQLPINRRQIPDIPSSIKDRIPFPMGSGQSYH